MSQGGEAKPPAGAREGGVAHLGKLIKPWGQLANQGLGSVVHSDGAPKDGWHLGGLGLYFVQPTGLAGCHHLNGLHTRAELLRAAPAAPLV